MHLVKGKLLLSMNIIPVLDERLAKWKTLDYVAVGGTFDYLHIGHKMLLTYCAITTDKELTIGITGEQMLKKKKNKSVMQSF